MAKPLAIFTPSIGAPSETFIQRHMHDLLPGGTVAVAAWEPEEADSSAWKAVCPVLRLAGLNRTFEGRARSLLRRKGISVSDVATKAVERYLKQHKVQVILGEYLDQSIQWFPVAQHLGIRFFAHAHGSDVSVRLREEEWREKYLCYNESNGTIVVSEYSRQRLVSLGINQSKIHIIPCCVDVPLGLRKRAPKETICCLAVGRMVAKKGPILTLDAFRRASEMLPNLYLEYVGTGELLPAAHQFVRAFNLEQRVTLHRSQPNQVVQRLMSESDIFLQHSMVDPETGDEEGLPVAILEAMAHGLPVVSTRHAGIPEAVTHGVTGYLVDEGNSVEMAEHIVTLASDSNLRQQMGEVGWQTAKEKFSWELERTQLLRVLNLDLISGTAIR